MRLRQFATDEAFFFALLLVLHNAEVIVRLARRTSCGRRTDGEKKSEPERVSFDVSITVEGERYVMPLIVANCFCSIQ